MTQRSATFTGIIAILLWALLTLFTVWSAPVPPLQLNAACFLIAGLIGVVWVTKTGKWSALKSVPLYVYAISGIGIFGYHFLFFSAIRHAPAAEASLINYLWPLLIVLFSGLLPREKLLMRHVIGASIALLGLIVLTVGDTSFSRDYFVGYGFALGAALAWSSYSVSSRLFANVPSSAVTISCLIAAALSLIAHIGLETTVWPQSSLGWFAVLALGLGPAGGAFFVWDIGMKKGNIQLLGTLSYGAPLISTALLILVGIAQPSFHILICALLITIGAYIAARPRKLAT